jgi:hypothetical protein
MQVAMEPDEKRLGQFAEDKLPGNGERQQG